MLRLHANTFAVWITRFARSHITLHTVTRLHVRAVTRLFTFVTVTLNLVWLHIWFVYPRGRFGRCGRLVVVCVAHALDFVTFPLPTVTFDTHTRLHLPVDLICSAFGSGCAWFGYYSLPSSPVRALLRLPDGVALLHTARARVRFGLLPHARAFTTRAHIAPRGWFPFS